MDDFKFGYQHSKQVFATPDHVKVAKYSINRKNVLFKLSHNGITVEYLAPKKSQKPFLKHNWKQLNKEIKELH